MDGSVGAKDIDTDRFERGFDVGTGTNARKRRRLPYNCPMSTDSLESLNDDIDSDIFSDEVRIAQEEWDESVTQLQLLISVVMLPVLGKWLGRRWSQWGT